MSFVIRGLQYVGQGIGSAATGFMLARDTNGLAGRNIQVQDVHRSQVIDDISKKILSKYLPGDRDKVGSTIRDLIEHVFFVFALKDLQVEENQEVAEDLLVDHFLSSILRLVIHEFKDGPNVTNKEHFVNIANSMLTTAFPGGTWDEKIPRAARYLLSDNFIAKGLARLVVDQQQDLSWKGLTELLATYLEDMYGSISHKPGAHSDPESGAAAFITDIRAWVDKTTKNTTEIKWFANKELTPSSNLFINRYIARVLRGEASQHEDGVVLADARKWTLDHLQNSMEVLYELIFIPTGDETEDARRSAFADKVLTNAVQVLPTADKNLKKIEAMADAEVLRELSIRNLVPQTDPKTALKCHIMADALKLILEKELRPEELAKRLPTFCTAETALSYLYSFLSSYVVETHAQLAEISERGIHSERRLKESGGKEISGWVDVGIEWAKKLCIPKRQDRVFDITSYPFINKLASHMLRSSNPVAAAFVESSLKNLVHVILDQAIGDKIDNPEQALADLINAGLQEGQDKVLELVKIMEEPQNEGFEKEFLTKATYTILEKTLPKAHFTSILPPFLRDAGLWEVLGDYLSSYFLQLYEQTNKVKELDLHDEFRVEEEDLKELIESFIKTVNVWLESPPEKGATSYERFKNQLKAGKGLKNVVRYVLPKLVQPLVAFHLKPKEAMSSEQRAAQLIVKLITSMQGGFDSIDQYEAAEDKKGWLALHGYTDDVIGAYRKQQDIPDVEDVDIRDLLLHEVSEEMVRVLLPQELLIKIVPDEESICNIDSILASLIFTYLERAYNYSHAMRELLYGEKNQQDEMMQEFEKFISEQIEEYFGSEASSNKTWVEEVTRLIFRAENEEQRALLKKFTPNIYFGAIGFCIQNANGNQNLLQLFAPVVKDAEKLFLVLNKNLSHEETVQELQITEQEFARSTHSKRYYWIYARRALDRLYTDEQWKQFIPELVQGFLTKDKAANFLVNIYDTIHRSQEILQREEQEAVALISQEEGLEEFLQTFFVDNIITLLKEIGTEDAPLNKKLPTLLDLFLKQCFADEDTGFGSIRDTVVRRLIFTMAKRVMTKDIPIVEQAKGIIRSYKQKDTFATAEKILETLLPENLVDTPLAKLVLSDMLKRQLGELVGHFHSSQDRILDRAKEAKNYLYSLPGMRAFYEDMMQGLDEKLDEFSQPKINRISEEFPDYVDELLKEALRDEELGPITKEFFRAVVTIIMQEVAEPKPGQTVEDRVIEALHDLMQAGKSPLDWMKTLLPEATMKELLPEFLQNVITHERLLKWFFEPYVEEINDTHMRIIDETEKAPDANVDRMQQFIQAFLLDYTRPYATTHGFLGKEGVVREIERGLLGALEDGRDEILTPSFQKYLNATVSQVTRGLAEKGILDPQFVTEALIASLDTLDESVPENMPEDEEFASRAKDKLLETLFPDGKDGLLVPDVAKEFVWKKVSTSIKEFFEEITDSDKRIAWVIDRLVPLVTHDEALLKERLQVVEDLRRPLLNGQPKDPSFDVKTEALFKRYTMDLALQKTEKQIDEKGWWWPIAWIAKQVMKCITYLYVRFFLRDKLYSYLVNANNNKKIRRLVWAFLHASPSSKKPDEAMKIELINKIKSSLGATGITPHLLNNYFAGDLANLVFNKNIVDILCE